MGMFDSVFVDCPHCGIKSELQTKQGKCILGKYDLVNAPPEVLLGVAGEQRCLHDTWDEVQGKHVERGCGKIFMVRVQCITKAWTDARVEEDLDD